MFDFAVTQRRTVVAVSPPAVGSIGYFIYFWSAGGGQTPGMRVLKLRVIKTDGSPVSTGSAFLRYIGMIHHLGGAVQAAVDSVL